MSFGLCDRLPIDILRLVLRRYIDINVLQFSNILCLFSRHIRQLRNNFLFGLKILQRFFTGKKQLSHANCTLMECKS